MNDTIRIHAMDLDTELSKLVRRKLLANVTAVRRDALTSLAPGRGRAAAQVMETLAQRGLLRRDVTEVVVQTYLERRHMTFEGSPDEVLARIEGMRVREMTRSKMADKALKELREICAETSRNRGYPKRMRNKRGRGRVEAFIEMVEDGSLP